MQQWKIPGFKKLLDSAKHESKRLTKPKVHNLSESQIENLLSVPYDLCSRFNLEPLLIDLSIIEPRIYANASQKPLAVSHILSDYDDQSGNILENYIEALLFLAKGTAKAGNAPIISHPELYKKAFTFSKSKKNFNPDNDTKFLQKNSTYSVFSWPYKQGNDTSTIQGQVNRLADQFRINLASSGASDQIKGTYEEAELIVIPFYRPDVDPILSGKWTKSGDPEPAGAVFIMIRTKKHDNEDLRLFADLIQRDLLFAALSESYGEMEIQRQRLHLYEGLGHSLKAMVQVTGWRTHGRNLSRLIAKSEGEQRLILQQANNGFNLFATVQALGELVRLVALLQRGRKEDFEKISNWVDIDELKSWQAGDEETIVSPFVETIKQISTSICRSSGWPRVTVTSLIHGKEEVFSWVNPDSTNQFEEMAEANISFDLNRLKIPPLKAGSDAIFAFIPAIIEPIRNALDYLLRNHQKFSEPHALQIRISSELPDFIRVEIGNAVDSHNIPHEGLPSGLDVTQGLVESIGLTKYIKSSQSDLDNDCKLYWITIHVTPQKLCQQIIEGS